MSARKNSIATPVSTSSANLKPPTTLLSVTLASLISALVDEMLPFVELRFEESSVVEDESAESEARDSLIRDEIPEKERAELFSCSSELFGTGSVELPRMSERERSDEERML